MAEELKPVLARQMENYAGFLEHTDYHVGRLIDAIEELGLLDNTLVYYIIGDNGASAEGTLQGTFNELISLNGMAELETAEFLRSRLDAWGGPESAPHYAVGWAHAMCTPYQWTKQVASHWGGTRNGTIVHWPGGIEAAGELRHQFHHVIDVAPTVLEATGIPEPTLAHGITQDPMHGVSMLDSFDDADASERRETQYFEMFGNRGIYHEGWSAVTKHRTPWQTVGNVGIAFDDDVWELYDGSVDWTQARDVSKANPAKLHDLQRLFLIEATRYQVLPLDDRSFERVLPEVSGKPELITGKKQILLPGMGGLTELHIVNIRNKSWSLTAQLQIPDSGASGALLKLGGHAGGLSFYLKDGKPAFCYNLFGIDHTYIRSDNPVPTGEHQVRVEFAYDGGGLGKGGDVSLYVDGDQVAAGRLEHTEPIGFGSTYTDVGRDSLPHVTNDYSSDDTTFTGTIKWLELEAGEDSHDHLIDPDHFIHVAMARQ
jgi:Sulfatase